MKFRRFMVSAVVLMVLVLSAGITVGLISARDHSQDVTQSRLDIALPSAGPPATPVSLQISDPPEKSQIVVMKTERLSVGTAEQRQEPSRKTAYTWRDGDRTQRVLLQEDLSAQKTSDSTPGNVVVAKAGKTVIVRKQGEPEQGDGPVFRSESGGTLMALPGGVLLKLDSSWGQDTVEKFLSDNGIDAERTSPIGFIENAFLVKTEPGFPSLELANSLASKEGVEISSPNWWMDVEAK